jgi:hypothetical protein
LTSIFFISYSVFLDILTLEGNETVPSSIRLISRAILLSSNGQNP